MPTTLHEEFITSIVEEVQLQLKSIQDASADFAKEIRSGGSASIKFADEEYGKHDPDAQFRHSKAQFPTSKSRCSNASRYPHLAYAERLVAWTLLRQIFEDGEGGWDSATFSAIPCYSPQALL